MTVMDYARPLTRVEIAQDAETRRREARRWMVVGMVIGALLTVAGNAVPPLAPESWETSPAPWFTVAVYVLCPMTAAWSAHVIGVLNTVGASIRASQQKLRDAPAFMKVAVGLGVWTFTLALAVSYMHLRQTCLLAGMDSVSALLFPATVDAQLLLCTVAAFALRPATELDMRRLAALDQQEREEQERQEHEQRVRLWLDAEQQWLAEQQEREAAQIRLWLDAEQRWLAEQQEREEQERAAAAERIRLWLEAEQEHWSVQAWLGAEKRWLAERAKAERARSLLVQPRSGAVISPQPVNGQPNGSVNGANVTSSDTPNGANVTSTASVNGQPFKVNGAVPWTAEHVEQLAERIVNGRNLDYSSQAVARALRMFAEGQSGRTVASAVGIAPATASSWRRMGMEEFASLSD